MKLLLRDYLGSLKEREELDAILPDLLSELGFSILSRPQRGTQQRGVDVAAVGPDDDGEKKIFLFSVKAGDLTRQDWDGTPQALRSSLNEIRDVYIPNRIPVRFSSLKVVICVVLGGVVQEQVRDQLKGYIEENTTARVFYDEWNGDKLAALLLTGVLREELLPKPLRSMFQKSVAMLDEPEISYQHFVNLVHELRAAGAISNKSKVRAARQLNLALWVIFVWARDIGNLEAPYRASEVAVLCAWDLMRPLIGKKGRENREMGLLVIQIINLHLTISSNFLDRSVTPYARVRHGLSSAVNSRDAVDVNLALFELLGRIGLSSLWLSWLGDLGIGSNADRPREAAANYVATGFLMIRNNPALMLPITDGQSTDVALFLLGWLHSGLGADDTIAWLEAMADKLDFSVRSRGRFPIVSSDYRDLAAHPSDRSDEYFEEVTTGSTLIPLIAAWLEAFGRSKAVESLALLAQEKLGHCTMQLWMPDEASEETIYAGDGAGRALCDLPVAEGGVPLLAVISTACKDDPGLLALSAVKTNNWPIVLLACRHHRLPVPPGFWIDALVPDKSEPAS